MSTRSKVGATTADEIEAIKQLMSDLEKRLQRIGSTAKSEASGGAGDITDFVSEALAGIMERVRDSAAAASDTVADRAANISSDALKKVVAEVETRPLTMLAIAAGIGFLFGLSSKR